jgi:hypothetical protein
MNAIAFLTFRPTAAMLDFYEQLSADGYHIYCFVDDSNYEIDEFNKYNYIKNNNITNVKSKQLTVIKMNEESCVSNGYTKFAIMPNSNKKVFSWDKAIYFFCCVSRGYENVWFIEDDVFIPNEKIIQIIDKKYLYADILSSDCIVNDTGEKDSWAWWQCVPDNIELPWAHSMVCAIRISNLLLSIIADYVIQSLDNKERIKYIEFIFHTLALKNNLNINKIQELQKIYFRKEWSYEDLDVNHLFHPVKAFDSHPEWRQRLITDEIQNGK